MFILRLRSKCSGLNLHPISPAILFFCNARLSGQSTGTVIDFDGGYRDISIELETAVWMCVCGLYERNDPLEKTE